MHAEPSGSVQSNLSHPPSVGSQSGELYSAEASTAGLAVIGSTPSALGTPTDVVSGAPSFVLPIQNDSLLGSGLPKVLSSPPIVAGTPLLPFSPMLTVGSQPYENELNIMRNISKPQRQTFTLPQKPDVHPTFRNLASFPPVELGVTITVGQIPHRLLCNLIVRAIMHMHHVCPLFHIPSLLLAVSNRTGCHEALLLALCGVGTRYGLEIPELQQAPFFCPERASELFIRSADQLLAAEKGKSESLEIAQALFLISYFDFCMMNQSAILVGFPARIARWDRYRGGTEAVLIDFFLPFFFFFVPTLQNFSSAVTMGKRLHCGEPVLCSASFRMRSRFSYHFGCLIPFAPVVSFLQRLAKRRTWISM
jgi:hypothetical protein